MNVYNRLSNIGHVSAFSVIHFFYFRDFIVPSGIIFIWYYLSTLDVILTNCHILLGSNMLDKISGRGGHCLHVYRGPRTKLKISGIQCCQTCRIATKNYWSWFKNSRKIRKRTSRPPQISRNPAVNFILILKQLKVTLVLKIQTVLLLERRLKTQAKWRCTEPMPI